MSAKRNIQHSLERIIKKIKTFLLSKASREVLVFLIFFAIASAFWLVRVLNDDYVVDIDVPVKLQNVPNHVIITHDLPSHLTFRVRDKGSVLLGYELGKVFAPIGIDFSDYRNASQQVTIVTSSLDRNSFSQFASTTKIISIRPYKMELFYTNGKNKKVPVVITGSIHPERQYFISDTLIRPTFVKAYAPQKVLDTLKAAFTTPVILKGIDNTTFYQVSLRKAKGVKFVPSNIRLVFHTDVYSEKTVEVPIQGINFPSNKKLLTFPSKVSVTFQVGSSLYKAIKATDFGIDLSYYDLIHFNRDKYPLRLSRIPNGVRNAQISPSQVDFLIEQN